MGSTLEALHTRTSSRVRREDNNVLAVIQKDWQQLKGLLYMLKVGSETMRRRRHIDQISNSRGHSRRRVQGYGFRGQVARKVVLEGMTQHHTSFMTDGKICFTG